MNVYESLSKSYEAISGAKDVNDMMNGDMDLDRSIATLSVVSAGIKILANKSTNETAKATMLTHALSVDMAIMGVSIAQAAKNIKAGEDLKAVSNLLATASLGVGVAASVAEMSPSTRTQALAKRLEVISLGLSAGSTTVDALPDIIEATRDLYNTGALTDTDLLTGFLKESMDDILLSKFMEDLSKEVYGYLPDELNPWLKNPDFYYPQPHECTPYDMDGDGIPDAIDKDPLTSYLDPNSDWPQWAKDLADITYRIAYYDPLALDLNGDGIITTLAEANSAGALFDHDGDGIRTATGWIAPQDGILVRDINGNGIFS